MNKLLTIRSSKTASKTTLVKTRAAHRNKKKPYLALLSADIRNQINRRFIKREKAGNQWQFSVKLCAGDIYESRSYYWDGQREAMMGGTIYFGVNADLSLESLTREEAFFAVNSNRIENTTTAQERKNEVDVINPSWATPPNFFFHEPRPAPSDPRRLSGK